MEPVVGIYYTGEEAFKMFATYGFPIEMTVELAKEKGYLVDEEGFKREFKKHQELSRESSKKKFGKI
jgi:alanyl-tRNA synthetase